MISKSIYYIIDHFRFFTICIIALFSVSFFFVISELKVDNSIKIWFSENDKNYQNFIDFQGKYGNDDIITILVSYPVRVYEKKPVAELLNLEHAIRELDYVDKVYSYGSSDFLNVTDTEFFVEKIISKVPENEIEQQEIIDRLKSSPAIKKTFLSDDEKSHLILVRLKSFEAIEVHRDNIVRELRTVIEQILPNYQLGGMAVLNEALNYTVAKESSIFSILSYAMIIMLMALFIKKKRFLPIAVIAILIPITLTFGLFAATGQKLNMISMVLPTILMVYSLADVVHITNIYIQLSESEPHIDKRELINRTLVYCFKPCFFASTTTMVAYISFYLSPVNVLKTTGLFAFIGIGFAFISVYLVTIIGFSILNHPSKEKDWNTAKVINRWTGTIIRRLNNTTTRQKVLVVTSFVLLFLLSLSLIPKVEINTYPGEYLSNKSKVRKDSEIIEAKIGAYLPFEAIIKCKDQGRIITREKLLFLENFQKRLNSEFSINNPTSIVDVIKYLNQQITGHENYYRIPKSEEVIAQLLMLYEMDMNNRINEITDRGYSEARISGRIKMLSSDDYSNLINDVHELFYESSKELNLELNIEGYMPLYVLMINYITKSLLLSFLGAFMMVIIMLFVYIRNIKITLISLITNIIPVSSVVLIMVAFKISLDMGTVMIAAIMLGVAVDDTMHLLHSYMNNIDKGMSVNKAVDNAIIITGPALLASTIALATGFLIIGLSSVKSLHNFGILCAFVVIITLIADTLLLPVIIKLFSKER